MSDSVDSGATETRSRSARRWEAAALFVSLAASIGSVFLSVGMGLKACPLCFYQRSFVMAVAAVLLVGRAIVPCRIGSASLLALPMSAGGLIVAGFHEWLVLSGTLECPKALLGLGTAPAQSLAAFIALTVCLLGASVSARDIGPRRLTSAIGATIALGAIMGWASIASAPPLPPPPAQPYDSVTQPLNTCRPPYRSE